MGHKNTNEPKTCDYANIELEKRVLLVCTCVCGLVCLKEMETLIKQVPILLRVTTETQSHKEIYVEDQACGFMPSTTNTSTGKHQL